MAGFARRAHGLFTLNKKWKQNIRCWIINNSARPRSPSERIVLPERFSDGSKGWNLYLGHHRSKNITQSCEREGKEKGMEY